jgi:putative ABC transport system permease protein
LKFEISKEVIVETLIRDLRYAVRGLLKQPAFTFIAVCSLALGIGANTAIFSLVNAVLLRPLNFHDADRLVMVWEDMSVIGFPRSDPAPGTFHDWKTQQTSFEDMASLDPRNVNLTGDGEPERITTFGVTANLFPLLGVTPLVGRNFSAEEDRAGGNKVAIISYGLWQRRYGGEQSVIGRGIMLDGQKYEVVGVMPRNFQLMQSYTGIWVPAAFSDKQLADHDNHFVTVIARLKSGVTLEQADADIKNITQRIVKEHPEEMEGIGSTVVPLREQLTGNVRRPLILLLVAVALVLLIACANITGLLMSRATGRRKEIALRTALGARRGRVVRQLLTESVLLASAGGLLGLLVAWWSFNLLKELIPGGMRLATRLEIDLPVLVFALAVSVLTGIVFGLVPALQASKVDLNEALKQGHGRTGAWARGGKLRSTFIVAQIALALILLIGAGLLMQTVFNLRDQYSGFQPAKLLTLRTALPNYKYGELPKRAAFFDQVLERVTNLPGVISAGYTTAVPLQWKGGANGFTIEGRQPEPGVFYNAIHRQISVNYFRTMGVTLRQGRNFEESDNQQSMPVAMVNETMARQYWPAGDCVGKRFKFGIENAPWITIVGVVGDVRQIGMDAPVKAEMYLPYRQVRTHFWYAPRDLVIRTNGDPLSLVGAVRQEIHAVDPDQPISNIATMDQLLVEETGPRRLGMFLLIGFAGLALLLASLGIYGVLSFFVAQQTPEIGVRMALGAQQGSILGLVLKKGMALTVAGVAIGLIAAFALSRLMVSLLFGVSANDPLTFGAIALLLMLVAFLACYIPARRATKIDPLVALRYE